MKMENSFLPHICHDANFPRPRPLLAAVIENYVFLLSPHVKASSIQHSMFEDFGCCA